MTEQEGQQTQTEPNPAVTSVAPGSTPSEPASAAEPTVQLTQEQLNQMIQTAAETARAATRDELAVQQPQQAEPAIPATAPAGPLEGLQSDDWVQVGAARTMQENFNARVGGIEQAAKHLYEQNVSILETNSRLQNPQLWEKYGKELEEIVGQRKQTTIITANDFKEAIDVIRGRHYRDLIDNEVQQRLADLPTTETALDGGAPLMAGDEALEIPEQWKNMYEKNGLNLRDIQAMLTRREQKYPGTTPSLKEYLKQMETTNFIADGREIKVSDIAIKDHKDV